MSVHNILQRLERVQQAGKSRWRAPCPVHQGKDRNLIVSERTDGSVGAHCFVCGAGGPELVEALGLPIKEIFSPDSDYVRPAVTAKMYEEKLADEMVMLMYNQEIRAGRRVSWEDKKRVRLAQARLEGISAIQSREKETKSVDERNG